MTTQLIACDAETGETVTVSMHPKEDRLALRWHGQNYQRNLVRLGTIEAQLRSGARLGDSEVSLRARNVAVSLRVEGQQHVLDELAAMLGTTEDVRTEAAPPPRGDAPMRTPTPVGDARSGQTKRIIPIVAPVNAVVARGGGLVVIAAAACLIVGPFLPWVEIGGLTFTGLVIEGGSWYSMYGIVEVALAGLAVVFGLATLSGVPGRHLPTYTAVVGVVAFWVCIEFIARPLGVEDVLGEVRYQPGVFVTISSSLGIVAGAMWSASCSPAHGLLVKANPGSAGIFAVAFGALLTVVGSLVPWWSFVGFGETISFNGVESEGPLTGIFTLVLGVLAFLAALIALAWQGRSILLFVAMALGWSAAGIGIAWAGTMLRLFAEVDLGRRIGPGPFIVIAGGAIIGLGARAMCLRPAGQGLR